VQLHDQICDIYSVLSAVPTLKHIYDIDDKKVVMTGDSAGAYLCGYMEAILTNPMLQHRLKLPKIETELSGLMLYSGVYDLSKLLSQKILLNMAKCIGESITNIKTKNINDIKKYKYFDAISLPQFVNKKWCPTMLSYSANDVFTKGQGEDMQSLLFANDIPVYTHTTNTFFDNHNYQLSFSATAKEALLKSLEFLEKIKENHHKKSKCIINPYIENILNK
jgi:acetyl esterase/lipase